MVGVFCAKNTNCCFGRVHSIRALAYFSRFLLLKSLTFIVAFVNGTKKARILLIYESERERERKGVFCYAIFSRKWNTASFTHVQIKKKKK